MQIMCQENTKEEHEMSQIVCPGCNRTNLGGSTWRLCPIPRGMRVVSKECPQCTSTCIMEIHKQEKDLPQTD